MAPLLEEFVRWQSMCTAPKPSRVAYTSRLGVKKTVQPGEHRKTTLEPQTEPATTNHVPRYGMFKSRLDKLNPEVPEIDKAQADDALIAFFALVTSTPTARMKELVENGFQGRLPSKGLQWESCKALWKDSEKWWKENGSS
ncbi:hypothetical protein LTR78_006128 [Recurvomyces mirabilis]|uniref:Uncharacterized protein n=1 Tax=Recurvomyces mirabilis TaxID=574656 RepID=A0AAE1C0B9_9PEZI|nr:hypothetical protein LTR78_006128 [Recurvomyces mirabilis]KAK5151971.1 hypothetical protein LTS14_008745 [Recurvomyces mirabilis]